MAFNNNDASYTNLLFKKYLGIVESGVTTVFSSEAPGNARPKVVSNSQLYAQAVPSIAPSDFALSGYVDASGNITQTNTNIGTISVSARYPWIQKIDNLVLETVTTRFCYRHKNPAISTNTNLLSNTIPFNYDPVNNSYNTILKTALGTHAESNSETVAQKYYLIDTDAGYLYILNNNWDASNGSPKITFYRYAGTIGIPTNLGNFAGAYNQGTGSIAYGNYAGSTGQSSNSIAIGNYAGSYNQGSNSIAIGYLAGPSGMKNNSIVLNASGTSLFATGPTGGFFASPITWSTCSTGPLYLLGYGADNQIVKVTGTDLSNMGIGGGGSVGGSFSVSVTGGTGYFQYVTGGNGSFKTITCGKSSSNIIPSLTCYTYNNIGANNAMFIGYDPSLNNIGTINFNYSATGSASNNLGIGLYGNDSILKIYPTGCSITGVLTSDSIIANGLTSCLGGMVADNIIINDTDAGEFFQVKYPEAFIATSIEMAGRNNLCNSSQIGQNRTPQNITICGSNNGFTWTKITTISNYVLVNIQLNRQYFSNTKSYLYYKVIATLFNPGNIPEKIIYNWDILSFTLFDSTKAYPSSPLTSLGQYEIKGSSILIKEIGYEYYSFLGNRSLVVDKWFSLGISGKYNHDTGVYQSNTGKNIQIKNSSGNSVWTLDSSGNVTQTGSITGGTGSFQYVTGGTGSFQYVTGGTGSFQSITGGTGSFQTINTSSINTGNNSELVIKTGLDDSAPSGSYITLRTASSSLGVNFVNNNNTVNWGSFRSDGFICNVPTRLNSGLNLPNGLTNAALNNDGTSFNIKSGGLTPLSVNLSTGLLTSQNGQSFKKNMFVYPDGVNSIYLTRSNTFDGNNMTGNTNAYGRYFGFEGVIYQDFYGQFQWRASDLSGTISNTPMSLSSTQLNVNVTGSFSDLRFTGKINDVTAAELSLLKSSVGGTGSFQYLTSNKIVPYTSGGDISIGQNDSYWTTITSGNMDRIGSNSRLPSVSYRDQSLSIAWNYEGLGGEISFLNNYGNGFAFYDRTGASTTKRLAYLTSNGLTLTDGSTNAILNNDGTSFNIKSSSLTPLSINLSTGLLTSQNGQSFSGGLTSEGQNFSGNTKIINNIPGDYFQVKYPTGFIATAVEMAARPNLSSRTPQNITICGSNDGVIWTKITDIINYDLVNITSNKVSFANTNSYSYYRVIATLFKNSPLFWSFIAFTLFDNSNAYPPDVLSSADIGYIISTSSTLNSVISGGDPAFFSSANFYVGDPKGFEYRILGNRKCYPYRYVDFYGYGFTTSNYDASGVYVGNNELFASTNAEVLNIIKGGLNCAMINNVQNVQTVTCSITGMLTSSGGQNFSGNTTANNIISKNSLSFPNSNSNSDFILNNDGNNFNIISKSSTEMSFPPGPLTIGNGYPVTSNLTIVHNSSYGSSILFNTVDTANGFYLAIGDPSRYDTNGVYKGGFTTLINSSGLSTSVAGDYFQVQYPSTVIATSVKIAGRNGLQLNSTQNRTVKNLTIAGSNDNSTWYYIADFTNSVFSNGIFTYFDFPSNKIPYIYYRFIATQLNTPCPFGIWDIYTIVLNYSSTTPFSINKSTGVSSFSQISTSNMSSQSITGGTGSFQYVTGGTGSFQYVTGGTGSFQYVTGGTGSFKTITCGKSSSNIIPSLTCYTYNNIGANNAMFIGYEPSTNNIGTINFNYTGSGSSSNNLGIGLYESDSILKIYKTGCSITGGLTLPNGSTNAILNNDGTSFNIKSGSLTPLSINLSTGLLTSQNGQSFSGGLFSSGGQSFSGDTIANNIISKNSLSFPNSNSNFILNNDGNNFNIISKSSTEMSFPPGPLAIGNGYPVTSNLTIRHNLSYGSSILFNTADTSNGFYLSIGPGNASTTLINSSGSTTVNGLYYQVQYPRSVIATSVKIAGRYGLQQSDSITNGQRDNRTVKNLTIAGSNDNSTWYYIADFTNSEYSNGSLTNFPFSSNTNPYTYYRFIATELNPNFYGLWDLYTIVLNYSSTTPFSINKSTGSITGSTGSFQTMTCGQSFSSDTIANNIISKNSLSFPNSNSNFILNNDGNNFNIISKSSTEMSFPPGPLAIGNGYPVTSNVIGTDATSSDGFFIFYNTAEMSDTGKYMSISHGYNGSGLYTRNFSTTLINSSGSTIVSGDYYQVQYPSSVIATSVKIGGRYGLQSGIGDNRAPKNFTIAGSNDNSTWYYIADFINSVFSNGSLTNFPFSSNTNPYTYYRFIVTQLNQNSYGYLDLYTIVLNYSSTTPFSINKSTGVLKTDNILASSITLQDGSCTNTLALPLNPTINNVWTPNSSGPRGNWYSICMSSTGQYQSACANGIRIYTSNNYGITWTQNSSAPANVFWLSICMSSSGQYQSACTNGSSIYTSTDYGTIWTQTAPSGPWRSICMSSSGQYQSACVYNGSIYTSTNYGSTWTISSASSGNWISICMSSSGQYQSACTNGSSIYTSTDYGSNWTISSAYNVAWFSICMSSSGQYQSACVYNGSIYTSTNYGSNWTISSAYNGAWRSICMSSSGQYQYACIYNGSIYTSTNYGSNWTIVPGTSGPTVNWYSICMSSSGQYQTACDNGNGYIYTSNMSLGPMSILDSQTISINSDTIIGWDGWTTGRTFSSAFTKYTDSSSVSVVGSVSMYSSGGGVTFSITLININTGSSYAFPHNCYFNTTGSHLCVGVLGRKIIPSGTYNVSLTFTSGSYATDFNDYIRLLIIISP